MISLEHVTKRYGKTAALRDVSLNVTAGRITGLLGRNGAGKTTALNLMTGYFAPDEGRVFVGGMDMMEKPRECKRMVGYLPEKPPLYTEMTVRDYLGFVCDLREVLKRGQKRHVAEIVGICGLQEVQERVIGHLSKGYQQRVGIAQALCGNPEVIVMDEPTVGLDPMQVVEMRELIRRLGTEHTILFSSHILSEVQQLCDNVLILDRGRLIRSFDMKKRSEDGMIRIELRAAGNPKEILPAIRSLSCVRDVQDIQAAEDGVSEVRITGKERDDRGRMTDQIFHLLAAMDCPIRRMTEEKDDLENVFLEAISK